MKKTILIIALILIATAFAQNGNTQKSQVQGLQNAMLHVENQEQVQQLEQIMNRIQERRRTQLANLSQLRFQLKNNETFADGVGEAKLFRFLRVKPNYTSQICSRCGQIGSRSKGSFVCHCGFSLNADLNASRNLAHPMLVERQGAITHPYNRVDEHKGTSQSAIACETMVKYPCL